MEHTGSLDALFDRARAHRIPMSTICERAKIAPTTPSRWRKGHNGPTLDRLERLHVALNEIIASSPVPDAKPSQVAA